MSNAVEPEVKKQKISDGGDNMQEHLPLVGFSDLIDSLQSECLATLGVRVLCDIRATCLSFQKYVADFLQCACRCKACMAPLFTVSEIRNLDKAAGDSVQIQPLVRLSDGVCLHVSTKDLLQGNVQLREYRRPSKTERFQLHFALMRLWRLASTDCSIMSYVKVSHVACRCCGLFLGMAITLEGYPEGPLSTTANIFNVRLLGSHLVARYLQIPGVDRNESSDAENANVIRCSGVGAPLSLAELAEDAPPRSSLVGGCGNVLTHVDSVLSKHHRWDAGRGNEQAWYVNSVRPNSIVVRNERPRMLAQGPMVVANVFCSKCEAEIGWKFVRDLQEQVLQGSRGSVRDALSAFRQGVPNSVSPPNACQEGRYGLVVSSLVASCPVQCESDSESNGRVRLTLRSDGRNPWSSPATSGDDSDESSIMDAIDANDIMLGFDEDSSDAENGESSEDDLAERIAAEDAAERAEDAEESQGDGDADDVNSGVAAALS